MTFTLNPSIFFSSLLQLSLAALIILSLATLFTTTLLRHKSAAARHLTWTAATLCLLCLPFFSLLPTPTSLPTTFAPLPHLT